MQIFDCSFHIICNAFEYWLRFNCLLFHKVPSESCCDTDNKVVLPNENILFRYVSVLRRGGDGFFFVDACMWIHLVRRPFDLYNMQIECMAITRAHSRFLSAYSSQVLVALQLKLNPFLVQIYSPARNSFFMRPLRSHFIYVRECMLAQITNLLSFDSNNG